MWIHANTARLKNTAVFANDCESKENLSVFETASISLQASMLILRCYDEQEVSIFNCVSVLL